MSEETTTTTETETDQSRTNETATQEDSKLSHADALSALSDARKESAGYRTKLRDAEAKLAQYEQDSEERDSAHAQREESLKRQWLHQHSGLPDFVIDQYVDNLDDLFSDDGTLDLQKLRGVEERAAKELGTAPRKTLRSGAGRTNDSLAKPDWRSLLG